MRYLRDVVLPPFDRQPYSGAVKRASLRPYAVSNRPEAAIVWRRAAPGEVVPLHRLWPRSGSATSKPPWLLGLLALREAQFSLATYNLARFDAKRCLGEVDGRPRTLADFGFDGPWSRDGSVVQGLYFTGEAGLNANPTSIEGASYGLQYAVDFLNSVLAAMYGGRSERVRLPTPQKCGRTPNVESNLVLHPMRDRRLGKSIS